EDAELRAAKGWTIAHRPSDATAALAWLDGLGSRAEARTLQWLRVLLLRADGKHGRAQALEERLGAPATSFEQLLKGLSIFHTRPVTRERCKQALDPLENAILQAERPRPVFYYGLLLIAGLAREPDRP